MEKKGRERFKYVRIETGEGGREQGIEEGRAKTSAARDIEEGNISIDVRFIELRPREMAKALNRDTCHFADRFLLLDFFASVRLSGGVMQRNEPTLHCE